MKNKQYKAIISDVDIGNFGRSFFLNYSFKTMDFIRPSICFESLLSTYKVYDTLFLNSNHLRLKKNWIWIAPISMKSSILAIIYMIHIFSIKKAMIVLSIDLNYLFDIRDKICGKKHVIWNLQSYCSNLGFFMTFDGDIFYFKFCHLF